MTAIHASMDICLFPTVNRQDFRRDMCFDKLAGYCGAAGVFKAFRQSFQRGQDFGGCRVEVEIRRLAKGQVMPDALESGVNHQDKRQIRIGGRIRRAKLHPAILAGGCRDADEL